MPWYKLPHADMVMWFDQDMDLEPGKKPDIEHHKEHFHVQLPGGSAIVGTAEDVVRNVKPEPEPEPEEEAAPFATGGVFKRLMHKIGHPDGVIDEVVIPNEPEPEEEAT